jgi:hypothetical protein
MSAKAHRCSRFAVRNAESNLPDVTYAVRTAAATASLDSASEKAR